MGCYNALMSKHHLAQVNIGRILAPLDSDVMAGFVQRLDEINALADGSPGFVWRLQTEAGNATELRPYDDDTILLNMSVWESVAHLNAYVYRSAHAEVLKQRRQWFANFGRPIAALWWIPAGHIPTVPEAVERLAALQERGPSPYAFDFRNPFEPPEASDD
jgi:heme-degrading monooxygenase HmoA